MNLVSDRLLFTSVLLYAVAMLAFAAQHAGRSARLRTATAARPSRQYVGAGAPVDAELAGGAEHQGCEGGPATTLLGRAAMVLTGLGAVTHGGSIAARGLSADRVPWGNMYEFSSAVAFTAVLVFLVLARRPAVRQAGAFVMLPVVLYLGLAGTVLYTRAGPVVPALNSYWIKIHVVAAILATGAFLLSGVLAALYLLKVRQLALVAADRRVRFPVSVAGALPAPEILDRLTYGIIAFAFPVWTFAVVAGAIWAEAAWGRYWGWDPKETWSFITWVLYAAYLHARVTAGWRGPRAAYLALAAAGALIVDYYVVNIFIVGLHSYAGI